MRDSPDANRYRLAADIGGTFTDIIALGRNSGEVVATKLPSRPDQPSDSVLEGVQDLLEDPTSLESLVHGQTVGLNAFLERRGARVLLLMTAGVRDAYTIARHDRRDLYSLQYRKPERLVRRRDTLEVVERLRADGSVEIALDPSSLEPAIERIAAQRIDAVAVCLLHAYVNPVHELRVRELLLERYPGLAVSLSSEVAREWREYERASSTVLSAYVGPSIERYLLRLEAQLAALGVDAPLRIMQSNGGVTSTRRARRQPLQTLLSGPVGGAIACADLGRATGRSNLLCADMGGTSFDMCLVVDGAASTSRETELEGLPLLLSLVDIHTIGAGGGSIAWLEVGGLRVGPRSAGARPGPACYGRGGVEPTVTDANLELGRLDPASFLGGRMSLDAAAAHAALSAVAREIGLDEIGLAEGVLKIVNAAMADAIRTITVKQGIDPREFTLVAFGGAGPMHAVALAEELELGEVVIPWSPGTFSAWGMLQADVRQDLVRSFFHPLEGVGAETVAQALSELESDGRAALELDSPLAEGITFVHAADMRYSGQEYTVEVPLPGARAPDLAALAGRFHEAHGLRYGHASPAAPVEIVNLRVGAIGVTKRWPASPPSLAGRRAPRTSAVVFDGREHETAILDRAALAAGERVDGPALVHEDSATTVIPPGWTLRSDGGRNLLVTRA